MFSNYSELLNELNTYLWVATVCFPILVFLIGAGSRSYFIGAVVWCVSQFISLKIEGPLWEIAKKHDIVLWFGTYATIDALCVTLIFLLHNKLKLKVGYEAFSIALCLAFVCFSQIARYTDGVILQTKVLGTFYKVAINTGNLASAVVLSLPLIMALLKKVKGHLERVKVN
ncbi:hypothetical protein L1285_20945 [Pseudoalteromonas sp. DL2-H2.2]|uniref:hypothetical protein n=1 Tax=Pseudoalteromonas sp. DL2-H2.2 TaxID=2908889 RepID=UPI001F28B03F|nr:hypothetical protein [Pseudoalteromonas sp. DL2-H2.2]MCF2910779.1 hypothetical protein [Pseudoalteromonas sp. DL2-H2.2]